MTTLVHETHNRGFLTHCSTYMGSIPNIDFNISEAYAFIIRKPAIADKVNLGLMTNACW